MFFIPHTNCLNDNYDICNYYSDNVLCLLNEILKDNCLYGYTIYLLYYHKDKLNVYENYISGLNFDGTVSFVYYKDSSAFLDAMIHSSIIFCDNYYYPCKYKVRSQTVVCLGYYAAPFKDDFWKIKERGYKKSIIDNIRINRAFDYHITSSDFCSREIALDSLIYLPKFYPLGFPRNDIFFKDNTQLRKEILSAIGLPTAKSIIVYAPTHRDYENKHSLLSDNSLVHNRTLFGNDNIENEDELSLILEKHDAVIIAKAHPIQNRTNIISRNERRIIYYSDIIQICSVGLQELLAISDLLITDYSSTFYDYLLTRRPIIHYCYDYDIQSAKRGFVINPVLPLAGGDVIYDFSSLCARINAYLTNGFEESPKADFIRSLIYLYQDGNSTKRIIDRFVPR